MKHFIVFVAALLSAIQLATVATADEAANEALARRFYEAFNAHSVAFEDFIADDVVDHMPAPGAQPGLPGLKAAMQGFYTGIPDIKLDLDLVLPKGDYVTVVSTSRGTHTGDFFGVPASGKPVEFHAIDVWLVRNGKLAEAWHIEDMLGLMAQMSAAGNSQ